MSTLEQIKEPIREELARFDEKFITSLKSTVPLLDKIIHYIIRHKGKQIRPIFVLLSARMFGAITESTYRAAALIELLHTATLIHDDVVDDSNMRRGIFSINALWKNRIAVLVGDYFLSKGLMLSVTNNEYKLLGIVSEAVQEMSEGELLQIEKNRKMNITEKDYFQIIRQKTATLIASSCASGAASVVQEENPVQKMREFGEAAGMAFQIKDDLLDFETDGSTGKPGGTDLKSKTLTLPLIHALNSVSGSEKKMIINLLHNGITQKGKAAKVLEYVNQSGGMDYARKKMNEKKDEALGKINDIPPSPAKDAMVKLVEFIIDRPN